MTRLALVGTGFWGAKLAEAVNRSSLELAACYSRDAGRRSDFAAHFGCAPAESYEAALEAADAVVLAKARRPPRRHAPVPARPGRAHG